MGFSRFLGALVKETTVTRDRRGRPESKPQGRRDYEEIRRYARRCRDMEDRIGPPVRFSPDVYGWWYMIKGPQRWIRQADKPGWHHGFYYRPGNWYPVVPPRDTWESPNSYHGQPGRSGLSHVVPAMVRLASSLQPETLHGYRRDDGSARREAKRSTERIASLPEQVNSSTKRGVTTVRTRPGRDATKTGSAGATVTRIDRRAPKRPTMKALTKKATTARTKAR
jgi:hypothetical protein